MSGLFKSLLSKTLTTFLYKYLSDVDVEGIALPSVYDGSGWGVRLSNVKLREGVQLLKKMPGSKIGKRKATRKLSRKRIRIVKRKRRKYIDRQPETSNTVDLPPHSDSRELPDENDVTSMPIQGSTAQSAPAMGDQPDDVSISQEEAVQTYYDTDSLTPPQNSKSILSCFYNSKTSQKQTVGQGPDITHLPEMPDLTGTKVGQPGKLLQQMYDSACVRGRYLMLISIFRRTIHGRGGC